MFSILYRIAFLLLFTLAIVPQVHADTQTLNEITADMGEYEKSQIYTAYLAQENANPDTVAMILDDVAHFEDNISFFSTYLTYKDAKPDILIMILDAIANFNEPQKAILYAIYLGREDANSEQISNILTITGTFTNRYNKALLYAAYLKRKNRDANIITMILAEAGIYNDENSKGILYQTYTATVGFLKTAVDFFRAHDLENERNNADIYQAYLMHEDADLETIAKILTVTSKFHNEYNKTKVYEAYLNRKNTAPKIVEDIFKIITNYTDDFYKIALYRAYIKNKNVSSYKAGIALTKTLSLPEYFTSSLYAAYFKRENVEPKAIAEILKIVADFKDYKNKDPVYEAYLMRVGVDLEITDETIKAVKSAPYKFRFYNAYMAQMDSDLGTIAEMLISEPLINIDDRAQAYKTYMARNDANPEIIEEMLTMTFKSSDRHYKAQVYKAYMESPHVEQEQVLKIAKANLNSSSPQYSFFKMYLMDKHADQAHIGDVLKNIKNFDEPAETVFYLAYLAATYAYAEDHSQFESDAVELAESPSHLKFLLQDPEQFEKIQHAIRYQVATTNPADAIILWQMLPGLRQNRAVKRAG